MKVCGQCGAGNADGAQVCGKCGAPLVSSDGVGSQPNGFLGAVKTCFRKYVGFEGRASRSEYWYFALFMWLLILAAFILAAIFRDIIGADQNTIFFALYGIILIAFFLPSVSVTVRRLHDTGKSGLWCFACLIPFVGGLAGFFIFICTLMPSEECDNEYGPYIA